MQDRNDCSVRSYGTFTTRRGALLRSSRASSDFAESFGSSVATVTAGSDRASRLAVAGMAHHAGQPPRDHVRRLQVGLGEHHDDRAVLLSGAEIHLPHQAADDPRAVELRAGMFGIEGKARDRQSAAALTASDRRRWRSRARRLPASAGRSGHRSGHRRRSTSACGSDALRRHAGGSAAARSRQRARDRRRRSRGSADRRPAPDRSRVTTTGRLRKRASSVSTVRKASTTRGLKPSPSTMPSMSRTLRCFAAASIESAPTTPMRSPSATDSAG